MSLPLLYNNAIMADSVKRDVLVPTEMEPCQMLPTSSSSSQSRTSAHRNTDNQFGCQSTLVADLLLGYHIRRGTLYVKNRTYAF